ncbi:portal protein [Pseudomonas sp. KnCO4]|uniref:portal protein n=1 Tax=Pseudomonas sp. KnCO4 TaxID=3381355 RepID=UPI003877B048
MRTATDIAANKEEKMLMLGPVLERINDELLDPLIDQTFIIMLRQSMPSQPAMTCIGRIEHTQLVVQHLHDRHAVQLCCCRD